MAALATVPGITVHASAPDAPAAGSAWPKWTESRLQGGKLTQPLAHTFEVLAVLPPGYGAATVEAADEVLPALVAALARVAAVDVADPVQLTYQPGNTVPALRIRCTPRPERTTRHE